MPLYSYTKAYVGSRKQDGQQGKGPDVKMCFKVRGNFANKILPLLILLTDCPLLLTVLAGCPLLLPVPSKVRPLKRSATEKNDALCTAALQVYKPLLFKHPHFYFGPLKYYTLVVHPAWLLLPYRSFIWLLIQASPKTLLRFAHFYLYK